MSDIKKLLEDKIVFSYSVSFLILGIFAFLLLGKYDVGTSMALDRRLVEIHDNIRLLENTTGYLDYLNRFNPQLAANKGANWLMETVTTLAKEEGITLGVIKPLEARNAAGYKIVRISADGSATYPSIMRLLKKLENYEKYISIEQIEMTMEKRRMENLGPSIIGQASLDGRGEKGAEPVAPAGAGTIKFNLNIASITQAI